MSDDAVETELRAMGDVISSAIAQAHDGKIITLDGLSETFDITAKTAWGMGLHLGLAIGALDSDAAAAIRAYFDREMFDGNQRVASSTNDEVLRLIEAARRP